MKEAEEQLCEAARKGDTERVKALIDSGADVTHFDGEGLNPLMHAAKQGHAPVLTLLLSAGAPWNDLSPSGLSAGDYAMQEGHSEAFDLLLNAGIQAELILGTIARKENKSGDSGVDYLEDRVSFSEDKLMDSESKAVMMAWEKPLMEAHAKAVCSGGGHVLNVGFGMGLVDSAIQQYAPASHTIVEAHPEVYQRMLRSGWGQKENVKIVFGRWQDVLSQLETYDGIGAADIAKTKLVKAAVLSHPSFVQGNNFRGIKAPIAIYGGQNDTLTPPSRIIEIERVLRDARPQVAYEVKIFPNVEHGWTLLYDPNDPKAVKAADKAHRMMINWFDKHVQD